MSRVRISFPAPFKQFKVRTLFEPFFITLCITLWGACMKTYYTPVDEIDRKWCMVNADGKVLGRIATEIARRLRGKHKPTFCNFQDNGDFVIVVNADRVHLTGKKWDDKKYYRHTGYMGGIKEQTAKEVREKTPEDLIIMAVKGMLPKNKLGRAQLKKLKVYAGADHPHAAQQPELLDI
jgi:large subunit ribosomal protein L13